jgi:hypothetical protein
MFIGLKGYNILADPLSRKLQDAGFKVRMRPRELKSRILTNNERCAFFKD